MKLSQRQIRALITEAIQGRHPGKPEPFMVQEAEEGSGSYAPVVANDMTAAVESLVQNWEAEALERYSEEDPSMAETGPEAWHDQVASAGAAMQERLMDVISKIEDELIDGQFYSPIPHNGKY